MALLNVYTYPEPVLRQNAVPVEEMDSHIRKLMDDMAETMYEAPGIGLAANQVGIAKQIIVIDLQKRDLEHNGLIILANPRIIAASGQIESEEGCLSVPDYYANVTRSESVTVRGVDPDGKELEISAKGLLAVVLQHEIDHLLGKLFVDRLGPIKRDLFKRRWKKMHKQE